MDQKLKKAKVFLISKCYIRFACIISLIFILSSTNITFGTSLDDITLSTNQMNRVMLAITNEAPELKDQPLYLNSFISNDTQQYIVTFLNFVVAGKENLHLVLSKSQANGELKLIGKLAFNDFLDINPQAKYGLLPEIYQFEDGNPAMVLIKEMFIKNEFTQITQREAIIFKVGGGSKILATVPYGCDYLSNFCKNKGDLVCQFTKKVNATLLLGKKFNQHYQYVVKFDTQQIDVVNGIDSAKKETKNLKLVYNNNSKVFDFGDTKKYTCQVR